MSILLLAEATIGESGRLGEHTGRTPCVYGLSSTGETASLPCPALLCSALLCDGTQHRTRNPSLMTSASGRLRSTLEYPCRPEAACWHHYNWHPMHSGIGCFPLMSRFSSSGKPLDSSNLAHQPARCHRRALAVLGVPLCHLRMTFAPAKVGETKVQVPECATRSDRPDIHSVS